MFLRLADQVFNPVQYYKMKSSYGASFDYDGMPVSYRPDSEAQDLNIPLQPAAPPTKIYEGVQPNLGGIHSTPKKTDNYIDNLLKNLSEQAPAAGAEEDGDSYDIGGLSNLWDDEPRTRDSIINSFPQNRGTGSEKKSDSYIDSLLSNLMEQQPQEPAEEEVSQPSPASISR